MFRSSFWNTKMHSIMIRSGVHTLSLFRQGCFTIRFSRWFSSESGAGDGRSFESSDELRQFVLTHSASKAPLVPPVAQTELSDERVEALARLAGLNPSASVVAALKKREGWISVLLSPETETTIADVGASAPAPFHSFNKQISLNSFARFRDNLKQADESKTSGEQTEQDESVVPHKTLMRLSSRQKDGYYER